MTQVVSAPMTMDTWLSMVILVVAVAALSALGSQVYSWFRVRPPRVETGPGPGPGSGLDNTGIRRAFTRTLRIVLSCFMLPLVALSFYQLDNAAYLPAYHISLAAILIATILAAFAWLLFQVPTRSLGALIFDGRKRYRSVPSSASGGGDQQHKSFVLALFTLVFVRGVAIGGLQISGRAQLAVLGACELVLLACIVQFQAYSMPSVGTVSAVARFASLICMVAFVPGVASDNARSVVGYLVLLLHLCMLIPGFFAPAAVHLGKICALRRNKPGPDVYNLRQLRRRPASRGGLPVRPPTSGPSFTDEDGSGPAHGRPDNAGSFQLDSSSISGRDYYRSPRPSRISHSPSVDFRDGGRPNATVPLSTSNVSKSDSEERPDSSYRTSSSNSSEAPSSSAAELQPEPLHPRWADYSFRESDLFYGVPRPLSAGPKASTSTSISASEPAGVSRPSIRSLSPFHLWARAISRQRSETAEQGFSVARPSRAFGFPPS